MRRFSARKLQRHPPKAKISQEPGVDAKMRKRKSNRTKGLSEFLGRAVLLSDKKSSNNARFLLPLVAKRGRPIGRQKNNPKKVRYGKSADEKKERGKTHQKSQKRASNYRPI